LLLLLLQRHGQSCGGLSAQTSDTTGSNASCPSRVFTSSSAAAGTQHMTVGMSPSLLAMERVMPKYASWPPADVTTVAAARSAGGRYRRDRKNVVVSGDCPLPLMLLPECGGIQPPCRDPAVRPVHPLPAAAADDDGGRGNGDGYGGTASASLMPETLTSSSSEVGFIRNAKEQLRARLSHRPAALSDFGQVGKAALCR